jgi:hypothetical protein
VVNGGGSDSFESLPPALPAQSVAVPRSEFVALPRREKTSESLMLPQTQNPSRGSVRGNAKDDDDEAAWRIEVMDRGKRYILRRGSGDLRETYAGGGGKFEDLPDENRREEYYANRETQSRRKRAAQQKRQSRHGAERDS